MEVLTIYLGQAGYYSDLTANFPNIYSIVTGSEFAVTYGNVITLVGIGITVIVFVIVWFIVLINKINFDSENIIAFGLLSVIVATFFLPRMHDRYMYVADILSVIWYICYRKKIFIPLTINCVSLYSYIKYLAGGVPMGLLIESIALIIMSYFILTIISRIFLSKKLLPLLAGGCIVILAACTGLFADTIYLWEVIYSVAYMSVIIYYSIYIIKHAINKKYDMYKLEGE